MSACLPASSLTSSRLPPLHHPRIPSTPPTHPRWLGLSFELQVFTSVLSADGETDPDVMAVSAASAALMCSDMPWAGPVAAARVALLRDNRLVAGPSVAQQEAAALTLLVACTADRVTMLEADGDQVRPACPCLPAWGANCLLQ